MLGEHPVCPWHIEGMSGWLIKISIDRIGGGQPMDQLYAAWEPDQAAALDLVRTAFAPTNDEVPESLVELSDRALRGVGLKPGQVGHVRTIS
jgi:hypothetical protein